MPVPQGQPAAPAASTAAPAAEPSFAQRKAAELGAERQQREEVAPAPIDDAASEEIPGQLEGLADDQEALLDELPGEEDDDLEPNPDLEDEPGADLDEQPGDEGDLAAKLQTAEKRYNDLRTEYDRVNANRTQREQEHAKSVTETLNLRFEMEDQLAGIEKRAEMIHTAMTGNAAQFRNINWAQVPPDKVAEVQQQAQHAFNMEQQANAAFQKTQDELKEARSTLKQREARVAEARLRLTIPGWNREVYSALKDFAVSSGQDPAVFAEITDPFVLEWAHAAMQIQKSSAPTKTHRKRKPRRPAAKQARRAAQTTRGKLAKAQKDFQPNQRGAFANIAQHRLAAERQGR